MRKLFVFIYFCCIVMTLQGQVLTKLPKHVERHQMDMQASLPEPSFEMDTTIVHIHFINWDSKKNASADVILNVFGVFPNLADNFRGLVDNEGHALIRFFSMEQVVLHLDWAMYIQKCFIYGLVKRQTYMLI